MTLFFNYAFEKNAATVSCYYTFMFLVPKHSQRMLRADWKIITITNYLELCLNLWNENYSLTISFFCCCSSLPRRYFITSFRFVHTHSFPLWREHTRACDEPANRVKTDTCCSCLGRRRRIIWYFEKSEWQKKLVLSNGRSRPAIVQGPQFIIEIRGWNRICLVTHFCIHIALFSLFRQKRT